MSANMQQDWKHWRLRREETGLAWLELDKADSSTNVLSSEVMSEFARVLDALDAASLERKRPITLPLLREMIQHGLEI